MSTSRRKPKEPTPQSLHRLAMERAHEADRLRDAGLYLRAAVEYGSACSTETAAAAHLLAGGDKDVEPTRGVLFRSAGTLALHCAEMLAREGLAGKPSADIEPELRQVLDKASFPPPGTPDPIRLLEALDAFGDLDHERMCEALGIDPDNNDSTVAESEMYRQVQRVLAVRRKA